MRGSIDEGDVRFTSGKRNKFKRASSITEMASQSEEELDAIRNAVIASEGLLLSVFDVLRRVPRRVLMVLKLNDLTRCMWFPFLAQPVIHYPSCPRNLDHALATTHSSVCTALVLVPSSDDSWLSRYGYFW
jgi:aarF domain-containing kinase